MRYYSATLLVLLMGVGSVQAGDWKLVWSDDFDKPGMPDESKWTYEEGFIRNRESQYYTRARRENARVEDGVLVIEARINVKVLTVFLPLRHQLDLVVLERRPLHVVIERSQIHFL